MTIFILLLVPMVPLVFDSQCNAECRERGFQSFMTTTLFLRIGLCTTVLTTVNNVFFAYYCLPITNKYIARLLCESCLLIFVFESVNLDTLLEKQWTKIQK